MIVVNEMEFNHFKTKSVNKESTIPCQETTYGEQHGGFKSISISECHICSTGIFTRPVKSKYINNQKMKKLKDVNIVDFDDLQP